MIKLKIKYGNSQTDISPASSFVLRRAGEVHKNPPERGSESLSRAGTLPHPEGGRTAAHRGEHGASATCAASFCCTC